MTSRGPSGRLNLAHLAPDRLVPGTLYPRQNPVNPRKWMKVWGPPTRIGGTGAKSRPVEYPEKPGDRAPCRIRPPTSRARPGAKAKMSSLTTETLARLWDDFDAREELLAAGRRRPPGRESAAHGARPRGGDVLLRLPLSDAGQGRRARSAITPPAGSRTRPRARCSSNARRGRPASTPSTRPAGSACSTSHSRSR